MIASIPSSLFVNNKENDRNMPFKDITKIKMRRDITKIKMRRDFYIGTRQFFLLFV